MSALKKAKWTIVMMIHIVSGI